MEPGPLAAVAALWGKEDPLSWKRHQDHSSTQLSGSGLANPEEDIDWATVFQPLSSKEPARQQAHADPLVPRPAFDVEPIFDHPQQPAHPSAASSGRCPHPGPTARPDAPSSANQASALRPSQPSPLRFEVDWVPSDLQAEEAVLAQGHLWSAGRAEAYHGQREDLPCSHAMDRGQLTPEQEQQWRHHQWAQQMQKQGFQSSPEENGGRQPAACDGNPASVDIPLEEEQINDFQPRPPGPPRDLGGRLTLEKNPDDYVQDILNMRHLPLREEEDHPKPDPKLAAGQPQPGGGPGPRVPLPFSPVILDEPERKPEEPSWVISSPDVAQDMRRKEVYAQEAMTPADWGEAIDVKAQRALLEARAKYEQQMKEEQRAMQNRGDRRQPLHSRVHYEYGSEAYEGPSLQQQQEAFHHLQQLQQQQQQLQLQQQQQRQWQEGGAEVPAGMMPPGCPAGMMPLGCPAAGMRPPGCPAAGMRPPGCPAGMMPPFRGDRCEAPPSVADLLPGGQQSRMPAYHPHAG